MSFSLFIIKSNQFHHKKPYKPFKQIFSMKDIKYEKEKAKEMLKLVNEYTENKDKKESNKKLNTISEELYYKKREILSQEMIDVSLALHSFTQAAMSGGHFQDLTEFVPDLERVIGS